MSNDVLDHLIASLRAQETDFSGPPRQVRDVMAAAFANIPRVETVSSEPALMGGIEGVWYRPAGAPTSKVVLYLHGGGYIAGSADTHAGLVSVLAREVGLNVFVPEYRLAPEHPFPAAVDDAMACYRGLCHNDLESIAVVGDSAGGGLAMSLLIGLKQQGLALPLCAVLWSPWVDLANQGGSHQSNAGADPILSTEGLAACARHYIGGSTPDDPRIRPLQTDLSGLPPLLIQAGSIEILLSDSLRLSASAARAHVPTRLDIYPGMPHVFQGFSFMLEEAATAVRDSATFIKRFCK